MEPVLIQNNRELMDSYYDLMYYCFHLDRDMMSSVLEGDYKSEGNDILGAVAEGSLAAAAIINDYDMFWNGKPVRMGGIGAVATWPEHRERHFVADILVESLKRMKEKGQIFSLLAPFSYPFYGKYGWAYGENREIVKINIEDLYRFQEDVFQYKRIVDPDVDALTDLFERCCARYNGAVVRSRNDWLFRFSMLRKNGEYAYGIYNAEGCLSGYLTYTIRDGVMRLSDWLYDGYPAKRAILGFAYQHRAQVRHLEIKIPMRDTLLHLLKTPRQEIRVQTGMMVRAVDVCQVLNLYSYGDTNLRFSIKVSDPYAPWNEKPQAVSVMDGNTLISPFDGDACEIDFQTDIGTFSQVVFGFIDWLEAEKQGKVQFRDKMLLERIASAMPAKTTFVTSEF